MRELQEQKTQLVRHNRESMRHLSGVSSLLSALTQPLLDKRQKLQRQGILSQFENSILKKLEARVCITNEDQRKHLIQPA